MTIRCVKRNLGNGRIDYDNQRHIRSSGWTRPVRGEAEINLHPTGDRISGCLGPQLGSCANDERAVEFGCNCAVATQVRQKEADMEAGQKLVVIGCGGVGAPASIFSRKLMPDVDVTNIREESHCIVR